MAYQFGVPFFQKLPFANKEPKGKNTWLMTARPHRKTSLRCLGATNYTAIAATLHRHRCESAPPSRKNRVGSSGAVQYNYRRAFLWRALFSERRAFSSERRCRRFIRSSQESIIISRLQCSCRCRCSCRCSCSRSCSRSRCRSLLATAFGTAAFGAAFGIAGTRIPCRSNSSSGVPT